MTGIHAALRRAAMLRRLTDAGVRPQYGHHLAAVAAANA